MWYISNAIYFSKRSLFCISYIQALYCSTSLSISKRLTHPYGMLFSSTLHPVCDKYYGLFPEDILPLLQNTRVGYYSFNGLFNWVFLVYDDETACSSMRVVFRKQTNLCSSIKGNVDAKNPAVFVWKELLRSKICCFDKLTLNQHVKANHTRNYCCWRGRSSSTAETRSFSEDHRPIRKI